MKRILLLVLCVILLCGCSAGKGVLDVGQRLRSDILNANGCSFSANIIADYGDEIYEFNMYCVFDKSGSLSFTVESPESISGISGNINGDDGLLTFDEHVLSFKTLADGQITPVSAPWVIMKAIRGGYIAAYSKEKEGYYFQLDDSYFEDPLTVDLWINQNGIPYYGELLWSGHRTLSVYISEFVLV